MLRLLPKSGRHAVGNTIDSSLSKYPLSEDAGTVRDRLYRFQYVVSSLMSAVSLPQIAEIMVTLGAATLHASAGSVWLFDKHEELYLAAYTGYPKESIERVPTIRKIGSTPTLDAIRLKKFIYIRSMEDRKKLYPHTVDIYKGTLKESFVAIPLLIGSTVLGAVNFAFKSIYDFNSEEQEFMMTLIQQCTQALDRARLYEEGLQEENLLKVVIDKLHTLQQVNALLLKATTPKEMANIVLKEGIRLFKAKGGEVSILSQDKKTFKRISHVGYSDDYAIRKRTKDEVNWEEVSTDKSLLWLEVAKKNKPLIISDLLQIPEKYTFAKKFFLLTGFHEIVLIPFHTEANLEGILSLYFASEISFKKEDMDLLLTLAQQFAETYDKVALFEAEKKQREKISDVFNRIKSLQDVTSALSQAITPSEVLQTITTEGVKTLGAKGGEIALLNEDKTKFQIVAFNGYPDIYKREFWKKWHEFSKNQPLIMSEAIVSRKPVYLGNVHDIQKKYKIAKRFIEITQFKSQATIPLLLHDEVKGVFQLSFTTVKNFTDEEKNFMLALAHQAAQAIERSKIYEEQHFLVERLSESEKKWKSLAENIPQLVWTGDRTGKENYFNKQWEKYSGASQKVLKNNNIWEPLIHPDDLERVNNIWRDALKNKTSYKFEYRLRNKKGNYHWFLSRGVPIKDRNNNIIQWLGTETDINDNRMAAQEIEKREARFRALIENSSDAIMLIDDHGMILYASPSTKRVTGYSPEERVGKPIFGVIYPKDKEKVKAFIEELLSLEEKKLLSIKYRQINKDGSIPWMEGVGRNMTNNPNVEALLMNYRDITERVEAEQAIRQAKDELEAIFENVADAIIVRAADGTILYCNQAAANLNKYASPEEFMQDLSYYNYLSQFDSFFDENGRQLAEEDLAVAHVLREKKPMNQVIRVVFRESRLQQWRKVKSTPILDTQGNIQLIVTVVQDITAEKEQDQTKDEFISMASHELKTPITSAKLYAGLLSDKIQKAGDEKIYGIVTKLDMQLDRLTKLINDLLDITKIKSGKLALHKGKVHVQEFIKDLVEEMQYATLTHTLQFTGSSAKILFLDKDRIRQVLINLISNAIKYSPQHNKIEISLTDDSRGVTICIKDFGIGIDKKEQGKIFEPFYRSASSNEMNIPGLGLGLHIAREIILKHGGKIWIESMKGKGTKMFVYLPSKYKFYD